jgi:hypothetical protein
VGCLSHFGWIFLIEIRKLWELVVGGAPRMTRIELFAPEVMGKSGQTTTQVSQKWLNLSNFVPEKRCEIRHNIRAKLSGEGV